MPRSFTVEDLGSGRKQFVLRRANSQPRSHHHDHPRFNTLSRNEMNNLLERERYLREDNHLLRRENHNLTSNWQTSDTELRTYKAWVPQLQAQVRALDQERHELRRRSAGSTSEMSEDLRELRAKYSRKKTDNERLTQTIRALKAQLQDAVDDRVSRLNAKVQDLLDELLDLRPRYQELLRGHSDLQRRHGDLNNHYVRVRDALDVANRTNTELRAENEQLRRMADLHDRILRRNGLLR